MKTERHISPAIGQFAIQQAPALYAEIDRLKASNKELVEALHGAMFFVPLGTKARDRADTAIAKATP